MPCSRYSRSRAAFSTSSRASASAAAAVRHAPCADATAAVSHLPNASSKARCPRGFSRSEEHTSELQSLMRISYAVFCLKKKKIKQVYEHNTTINTQNTTEIHE